MIKELQIHIQILQQIIEKTNPTDVNQKEKNAR